MNFANKITITRIFLVPIFIASIIYYRGSEELFRFSALTIFFIAVISDAIDGLIARARPDKSRLGAFLDPVADKLLLTSAFVALSLNKNFLLPAWLTLIVVSRDVIILLGSAIIHMTTGALRVIPSRFGKISTFFQMSTILVTLLRPAISYVFLLWVATAIFTVISGVGYIVRGSRILTEHQLNK